MLANMLVRLSMNCDYNANEQLATFGAVFAEQNLN